MISINGIVAKNENFSQEMALKRNGDASCTRNPRFQHQDLEPSESAAAIFLANLSWAELLASAAPKAKMNCWLVSLMPV